MDETKDTAAKSNKRDDVNLTTELQGSNEIGQNNDQEDSFFNAIMKNFDVIAENNSQDMKNFTDDLIKQSNSNDVEKELKEHLKEDGINIDSDSESKEKWVDKVKLPRGYSDISLNSLVSR